MAPLTALTAWDRGVADAYLFLKKMGTELREQHFLEDSFKNFANSRPETDGPAVRGAFVTGVNIARMQPSGV